MTMFQDKTGKALSFEEAWVKILKRLESILLDFELMLLRWVGHVPFHHFRRLCYRLAGVKIGRGSAVHMWCNFFQPKGVMIGEDTIIGDHAFLDGRAPLKIGDHVDIASEVLIYNSEHNIHSENMEVQEEPITIEDYVFIGPRAIILPGVTVGKGAVIAAGAVVTHDVPSGKVVGGVPAREIMERGLNDYSYRLGRARWFQ